MAELFMECEEEELEPWQQKSKPIIVDDDDDDDEPIFVGEILSSKPTSTYILNRVNPGSSRIGLQNGAPKRGAVPVSPGFQSTTRPAASTLAVQPQPRVSSLSGSAQVLQRPLSGCPSPQEAAKSSAGASQSVGRPATAPALSRNLSIPVLAQSASRPVATVTAQPVMLNRGTPSNTSGLAFGLRQNAGGPPCQGGLAVNTTSLPKRPSTSDANSVSPKKAKAGEVGPESGSPGLLSAPSSNESSLLPKGASSSNLKNGAPFPQACPKCNIHFNLLEPLKNHIKYCCPEMMPASLGGPQLDRSGTQAKTAEAESGKLIMLVNDFYYGKHEGNIQQVRQEQKTHTTFKCASCMKVLKSNIRFMNHMKHHLELEKQNSESWESHTTCQHCYRQFPTPFQLQCHIESTHTPYESSTICKICELSFETEQVLLQHMKDNHKPGEMPYVCQVCSYRSSAFSDVEKHFRAVHENTKSLLCPFCLKVIKLGTTYMHHFMRHQKKGVHRCTKCRLQFLTCKEKMDHKSQHHRTFKKPPQLEGLPPGTKVTIRASVGSLPPAATGAPATCATPSAFTLSPVANMAKSLHKGNPGKGRSKSKMLSLQKKQSASGSSSSASSSSSNSSAGCNKKNTKIANTALNNLRCPGIQKCIECYSDIRTFASHFPAYVRCSLCRYSTSCSKAYVNHMMSFHSARQNKRFWIFKTHSDDLSGMTVVCLNCDVLTNASEVDQMAAHLNDNDTHTCQIIMEDVPSATLAAAAAAAADDDDDDDLAAQSSGVLLNQESDGKSQKHSRPSSPEEQKDKSACRSPQMELAGEAASADSPGKQSGEAALGIGSEAPKPPGEGSPSAPGPPPLGAEEPEGPVEGGEAGHLGLPPSEGPSLPEDHEEPSSALGEVSGAGSQGCSEEGREADELGRNPGDGLPAAEGGGSPPLSQGEEPAAALEPPPGSEGSVGGGSAEGLVCQGKVGLFDTECEKGPPPLSPGDATCPGPSAHSRDPQGAPKEGDAGDPADQGLGFPAAKCEEKASLSVPADLSCPGPPSCSDDQVASAHDEVAGCQTDQGGGGGGGDCLGTESNEEAPPSSVPERSSSPGHSPGSGGPVTPTEGEEGNLANRGDSFLAAEEGEAPSLLAPETPSGLVPSCGSADPADVAGGGGGGGSEEAMECPAEEAPLAAGGEETPTGPSQAEASLSGAQEPPKEPWKETAPDQLGEEPAAACEGSPSAPLAGKEPPSLGLQAALAESPSGEKATPVEGPGGGGEGEEPSVPGGDEEAPGHKAQEAASEVQAGGSPSDEAELVDVLVVNTEVTSDEDVIFEQFLSRNAEPASANSDTSEQGSAHLEPLTPSEVLEHEATEILQKGAAGPSGAGAGAEEEGEAEEEEEEAEAGSPPREGSPTPEAASEGPPEGGDEAS